MLERSEDFLFLPYKLDIDMSVAGIVCNHWILLYNVGTFDLYVVRIKHVGNETKAKTFQIAPKNKQRNFLVLSAP